MKYDCIIIGGGLSGLAAGIRLAHFGKKVCICEKHSKCGGLNSYYNRKGIEIDSGLHAMTNFARAKDSKALPLLKLLRQLRIPHEKLQLREQNASRIVFPDTILNFSNDISYLKSEIEQNFPADIDNFLKFDSHVSQYDGLDVNAGYLSARTVLKGYIKSELLIEMLLCPLMYYGSAVENDMDFAQFAIMYKSIFHEGFCRPASGIKILLDLLLERFEECGGTIVKNSSNFTGKSEAVLALNCEIRRINSVNGKVTSVELNSGQIMETDKILSSAGFSETMGIVDPINSIEVKEGQLAFVETVAVLDSPMSEHGYDSTITFFNDSRKFAYQNPVNNFDTHSGVVCCPRNFQFVSGDTLPHPQIRVTMLANNRKWFEMDREEYIKNKSLAEKEAMKLAGNYSGFEQISDHISFTDIFTPKTIKRYTGHTNGAVYGSPDKQKNGSALIEGLYLCGTDQGFLGITGSMLSGISMANMHVLRG